MIKSTDVHSNICTFFNLHPIYFYRYLCYNVRKGQSQVYAKQPAKPASVTSCYLVLEKAFCDFCLSGFVMVSYKAIILTFSLRMIFLRVADIERIKSHKGEISLWINSF